MIKVQLYGVAVSRSGDGLGGSVSLRASAAEGALNAHRGRCYNASAYQAHSFWTRIDMSSTYPWQKVIPGSTSNFPFPVQAS